MTSTSDKSIRFNPFSSEAGTFLTQLGFQTKSLQAAGYSYEAMQTFAGQDQYLDPTNNHQIFRFAQLPESIQQSSKAVVAFYAEGNSDAPSGSGVVVSHGLRPFILTSAHIFEGHPENFKYQLSDGRLVVIRNSDILVNDGNLDVVILRIPDEIGKDNLPSVSLNVDLDRFIAKQSVVRVSDEEIQKLFDQAFVQVLLRSARWEISATAHLGHGESGEWIANPGAGASYDLLGDAVVGISPIDLRIGAEAALTGRFHQERMILGTIEPRIKLWDVCYLGVLLGAGVLTSDQGHEKAGMFDFRLGLPVDGMVISVLPGFEFAPEGAVVGVNGQVSYQF